MLDRKATVVELVVTMLALMLAMLPGLVIVNIRQEAQDQRLNEAVALQMQVLREVRFVRSLVQQTANSFERRSGIRR